MCFFRGVNFIISALIRNEGCEQFLFCVFVLLTKKHFEQQPISPVLWELWEQGELFSMKHWKAIKTDPKYDCIIYSIIHLNGNIVVSFLNQQVWGYKLLLKQVGSVHSWPLCCFLSGSLGVTGLKTGVFLSTLCASCHFQHWFGLCPTRALFTAPQRAKN